VSPDPEKLPEEMSYPPLREEPWSGHKDKSTICTLFMPQLRDQSPSRGFGLAFALFHIPTALPLRRSLAKHFATAFGTLIDACPQLCVLAESLLEAVPHGSTVETVLERLLYVLQFQQPLQVLVNS